MWTLPQLNQILLVKMRILGQTQLCGCSLQIFRKPDENGQ